MKTPESMTQITVPTEDLLTYEVILPLGSYTSGTYTIPNGRTWDDFYLLIFTGGRTSSSAACGLFPDEMFTSAGWEAKFTPDRDASGNFAQLEYASATTFTVSRGGAGTANMLIGYLK
jgi:hypothetical protein